MHIAKYALQKDWRRVVAIDRMALAAPDTSPSNTSQLLQYTKISGSNFVSRAKICSCYLL
jgi:hypothetical protein